MDGVFVELEGQHRATGVSERRTGPTPAAWQSGVPAQGDQQHDEILLRE